LIKEKGERRAFGRLRFEGKGKRRKDKGKRGKKKVKGERKNSVKGERELK
jgi:hypothetical protein